MRAVDPSIKLVAAGSSNYGADWIAWNRGVLQRLRNQADYIAIHTYINNGPNDLERYLGGWQQTIDRYIETTAALIREVRTGQNPRPIYIAYDEYNVWYRTGVREGLEEIYTFEDALAIGVFFNSFFRHADVVKMANMAQMVNVIAPIMANESGVFLQPTYLPLVEYGKQRGNVALDVWWDSPRYTIQNRPAEIRYLDISATYDAKTRQVFLNVLNRSKDKDLTAEIVSQSGAMSGAKGFWQMNHPDLKATHTYGDDRKVNPIVGHIDGRGGDTFRRTFPAHSLTILTMTLQ
jgi:alpha-N-arabinofuranosidase